jgi:hypothetical protein
VPPPHPAAERRSRAASRSGMLRLVLFLFEASDLRPRQRGDRHPVGGDGERRGSRRPPPGGCAGVADRRPCSIRQRIISRREIPVSAARALISSETGLPRSSNARFLWSSG